MKGHALRVHNLHDDVSHVLVLFTQDLIAALDHSDL